MRSLVSGASADNPRRQLLLVEAGGGLAHFGDLSVVGARSVVVDDLPGQILRRQYQRQLLPLEIELREVVAVRAGKVALADFLNAANSVVGVVDGSSPLGVEDEAAAETRRKFLRTIGYKR